MNPRILTVNQPGVVMPQQIRLAGKWLAKAGFSAGQKITVTQMGDGVLELRRLPEKAQP